MGPMIQIIMAKVVESPTPACGEGRWEERGRRGSYTAPSWRTQKGTQSKGLGSPKVYVPGPSNDARF